MTKQLDLKSRVYKFYRLHADKGKPFTWNHFKLEGESRATVYRLMKHCEQNKPEERKKGSGRKPKIDTSVNRGRLKRMMDHRKGKSLRKVAKKMKCSKSTVWNMLRKMKQPILNYKRRKRPKRTAIQRLVARPKCRQIYMNYRHHKFILDDESYFTLSNADMNGNDSYYSSNPNITPETVKYYDVAKFEPKILVWVAISPSGMSDYWIVPSKMAINQKVYLEECLKRRLVPFIEKYHRGNNYVFWPDLASAHYANSVQDWLREQGIHCLPKKINPANVPEARPIEDFWAHLKRMVYEDGWEAQNVKQLEKKIRSCLGKFEVKAVQSLAASTIKRVDRVRRYGVR
jgi:transposase